jgi:Ran GTPase-activating protein (RanGAP) involved in mRNA processing and transport
VELQVMRDLLTKYLTQIVSDSKGANEVVGILKKRPFVTQITLSQNALGDEGLQIILQYLTHNSTSLSVTSLNLNSCNLGNTALEQLGLYLKNQRTLQNLSLQNVRSFSHN